MLFRPYEELKEFCARVWNASDIVPSSNVLPVYIPLLHKKCCYASELYKESDTDKNLPSTYTRYSRVLYLSSKFVTIFYLIKLRDN
jgi:hypothetical protein